MMIKYLSILHMAKNVLRKQFGNMYGTNKPFNVEETPKLTSTSNPLPLMEPPTFTMKGIIVFTLLVFILMMLYLNREAIFTFFKRIYTDFKVNDKLDELEEKYNELTQKSTLLNDMMGRLDQSDKNNKELLEKTEKMHKETIDTLTNHNPTLDPTKLDAIQNRLDSMEKNTPVSDPKLDEIQHRLDSMENTPPTSVPTDFSETNTSRPISQENRPTSIEQKERVRKETEKQIQNGGVKQLDERLSRFRKDQIANYNGFCYIGYDNKRECTNVYEGDICMSGQIFPTMEICVNP